MFTYKNKIKQNKLIYIINIIFIVNEICDFMALLRVGTCYYSLSVGRRRKSVRSACYVVFISVRSACYVVFISVCSACYVVFISVCSACYVVFISVRSACCVVFISVCSA